MAGCIQYQYIFLYWIWGIHVSCIFINNIGYILPTIGGYMSGFDGLLNVHFVKYIFVLDIYCQQFWGYMSVGYMYWYWIYAANNWGIHVSWGVSVRRFGEFAFSEIYIAM